MPDPPESVARAPSGLVPRRASVVTRLCRVGLHRAAEDSYDAWWVRHSGSNRARSQQAEPGSAKISESCTVPAPGPHVQSTRAVLRGRKAFRTPLWKASTHRAAPRRSTLPPPQVHQQTFPRRLGLARTIISHGATFHRVAGLIRGVFRGIRGTPGWLDPVIPGLSIGRECEVEVSGQIMQPAVELVISKFSPGISGCEEEGQRSPKIFRASRCKFASVSTPTASIFSNCPACGGISRIRSSAKLPRPSTSNPVCKRSRSNQQAASAVAGSRTTPPRAPAQRLN